MTRCVYEKDFAFAFGSFPFVKHHKTAGNAVAVEQLRWQYDDAFDEVGFDEPLTYDILRVCLLLATILFFGLFRLSTKQYALWHDNDGATGGLERPYNLL